MGGPAVHAAPRGRPCGRGAGRGVPPVVPRPLWFWGRHASPRPHFVSHLESVLSQKHLQRGGHGGWVGVAVGPGESPRGARPAPGVPRARRAPKTRRVRPAPRAPVTARGAPRPLPPRRRGQAADYESHKQLPVLTHKPSTLFPLHPGPSPQGHSPAVRHTRPVAQLAAVAAARRLVVVAAVFTARVGRIPEALARGVAGARAPVAQVHARPRPVHGHGQGEHEDEDSGGTGHEGCGVRAWVRVRGRRALAARRGPLTAR